MRSHRSEARVRAIRHDLGLFRRALGHVDRSIPDWAEADRLADEQRKCRQRKPWLLDWDTVESAAYWRGRRKGDTL